MLVTQRLTLTERAQEGPGERGSAGSPAGSAHASRVLTGVLLGAKDTAVYGEAFQHARGRRVCDASSGHPGPCSGTTQLARCPRPQRASGLSQGQGPAFWCLSA